jgi:TsgA-like MFS transporter
MLIEMGSSTGIEITNLGLIFTFYTVGAVAGQLTSLIYNRRFTKIQVTVASYILLIPLIILLIFSSSLIVFYIVYLLSGYILGVIWIQANEFVLENKIKNKDRIVTILLTFYPIGALIAPFISATIIKAGLNWTFSYYVIIFLIVVNVVLYLTITARRKSSATSGKSEKLSLRSVFTSKLRNIIFMFVFLAIIFYCWSEIVVATWSPTYFRIAKDLDIQSAGFLLTLFYLFIVIGRGISLILAGRVKSTVIMMSILPVAIIAMFVVIFIDSRYLIYILIALAGLGYSAMFPLLVSTGSTLYERGRGILATGLFIASNIGISIAPFVTKIISRNNLPMSLGISVILIFIVFVIVIVIHIISARKKIF